MGEGLGCGAGSDPAEVFGKGAVADPEEAVLDLPMGSGQVEKAARVEGGFGERGDGVDDLALAERAGLAPPLDASHACGPRPDPVEPARDGADGDAAGLDATVRLLDGVGAAQVGRVDAAVRLTGVGGQA